MNRQCFALNWGEFLESGGSGTAGLPEVLEPAAEAGTAKIDDTLLAPPTVQNMPEGFRRPPLIQII
jgi:hypothetical protein